MGIAIGYGGFGEERGDRGGLIWRTAYGAFSRWRESVAEAAGYQVVMVKCRPGEMDYETPASYYAPGADRRYHGLHWPLILIDWGHITEANLNGVWDEMPADPLRLIIAHHDHAGALPAEYLAPLADRLEELLPDLDNARWGHPPANSIAEYTEMFICGLRAAAAAGQPLWFG